MYLCKDENAVNCEYLEEDKDVGGWAIDCKDNYFLSSDYECIKNNEGGY